MLQGNEEAFFNVQNSQDCSPISRGQALSDNDEIIGRILLNKKCVQLLENRIRILFKKFLCIILSILF
jgi:hypothetical protein